MTGHENSEKTDPLTEEPDEHDVVRRGPISDPEQDENKATEESDDPNRFDAG
ncbi:hypothetical protein [Glutamicibacter sp.]|jgi:hypothetical protein|uniref:hypothetical protein n=1 Tax=Glutamicibacter sp. TaxID=1931995 RepID=UPI002B45CE59|nr:hypothetical protein [Glutamicibacter sp.]HJX77066.1 hypothetical protein [Glutamicibacter sp.]